MATKLLLAMSLLVAVSAKWDEADKAKDVSLFAMKVYTAAGCDASTFKEYAYKEVGTCWPDGSDYRLAKVTDTHWVQQKFTDAKCTMLKSPLEEEQIPKTCTAKEDGEWRTGKVDLTAGTLYLEIFTAAGCANSARTDRVYHGGDKCQKYDGVAGKKSSKEVLAMNGGDASKMMYTSEDCSGTATEDHKLVGNGVCTAFPSNHPQVGKWYTLWVWHPDGLSDATTTVSSGSISDANQVAITVSLRLVLSACFTALFITAL